MEGGSKYFDHLRVDDLRTELNKRGIDTTGKLKPALEKEFETLKMGISNFPAMLQINPQQSLESLDLKAYEVSPCEPLHDLKGHFTNLIAETLHVATGTVLTDIKKIKQTILNKETLRGSDYRKAIILMYLKLKEVGADQQLLLIYRTAVEICDSHYEKRTPRAILRLHIVRFSMLTRVPNYLHSQGLSQGGRCSAGTSIQLPLILHSCTASSVCVLQTPNSKSESLVSQRPSQRPHPTITHNMLSKTSYRGYKWKRKFIALTLCAHQEVKSKHSHKPWVQCLTQSYRTF